MPTTACRPRFEPHRAVQGGLGAVAAALLAALHRAGGIAAARALYRALLPLPPPGGDFFRRLLQLEMEEQAASSAAAAAAGAARGGDPLPSRQLRDLFEAAVDAYGSEDAQLWLLYAEWAASAGASGAEASGSSAGGGGAAGVYWKARKALRHPEAFEAAYQLRFKLQPTALA